MGYWAVGLVLITGCINALSNDGVAKTGVIVRSVSGGWPAALRMFGKIGAPAQEIGRQIRRQDGWP